MSDMIPNSIPSTASEAGPTPIPSISSPMSIDNLPLDNSSDDESESKRGDAVVPSIEQPRPEVEGDSKSVGVPTPAEENNGSVESTHALHPQSSPL